MKNGMSTYDSVYATINAQIGPRVNTDLEVAYIKEKGTNIDDRGWESFLGCEQSLPVAHRGIQGGLL